MDLHSHDEYLIRKDTKSQATLKAIQEALIVSLIVFDISPEVQIYIGIN